MIEKEGVILVEKGLFGVKDIQKKTYDVMKNIVATFLVDCPEPKQQKIIIKEFLSLCVLISHHEVNFQTMFTNLTSEVLHK